MANERRIEEIDAFLNKFDFKNYFRDAKIETTINSDELYTLSNSCENHLDLNGEDLIIKDSRNDYFSIPLVAGNYAGNTAEIHREWTHCDDDAYKAFDFYSGTYTDYKKDFIIDLKTFIVEKTKLIEALNKVNDSYEKIRLENDKVTTKLTLLKEPKRPLVFGMNKYEKELSSYYKKKDNWEYHIKENLDKISIYNTAKVYLTDLLNNYDEYKSKVEEKNRLIQVLKETKSNKSNNTKKENSKELGEE